MIPNISKDTIIRTVLLMLALLNQVLTMFGKNPLPFSDEALYEGLSTVVTVCTALWSWWKNNSFTKAARSADAYLAEIRACETDNDV